MEMKSAIRGPLCVLALTSCAASAFDVSKITDVYVADFSSEDIKRCRPSDVDLDHREAKAFFVRAKQIDKKTLHDHYDFAPCSIEGTLKYKSKSCNWEIRAGKTGHIACDKHVRYFACDACNDLFKIAP